MQSKQIAGLVVMLGCVAAANAQLSSVVIHERNWNDFPGSTLTTTNNFPALIRFEDSATQATGYANQHRWLFSSDGVNDALLGPTDFLEFQCDYSVSSNDPARRKEGGIITDGAGDGKFMVASDGEIAVFGGPFTFYSFTVEHGMVYTPGTTIHLKLRLFHDTDDANKMQYWAGDKTSGPLIFTNLEQMLPPNSVLGGFAQPQLGGGTLETSDYKWENIRAYKLYFGKLSGIVTLGDFAGDVSAANVTVALRTPGTTTVVDSKNVTLSATGEYQYDFGALMGTYDVAIKGSHWLRKVVPNVTLDKTGTGGIDASLINGDIDDDNSVTVFDYTALSDAFDTVPGDSNWNPAADLDGDGAVTVFDYSILSSNFDMNGTD